MNARNQLTFSNINSTDLLKGRHILVVESLVSKKTVSLHIPIFTIGRHPNNSLVFNDTLISRHHATIAWLKCKDKPDLKYNDYGYWIIDGKGKNRRSRNGISINGIKKVLHRLRNGDIITIGNNIKITYKNLTYTTEGNQKVDTVYYL